MATRKENADTLKQLIGLEIDTERSDPKADLLTTWAARAATDAAGARRDVLAWQLEDKLDTTVLESATAEQLENWLSRVDAERDAVLSEVQGTSQNQPPISTAANTTSQQVAAADTISVKVNAAIAAYGGTIADPDQPEEGHRVIGDKAVAVKKTVTVTQHLANGTLIKG